VYWSPHNSSIITIKENVLYALIFTTEATLFTPIPIAFC
jgi:hypothetical protein